MIDDTDDLAIWRERTARTCRVCGCKSVVDGRCTICGAAKVVAGEPWKVSIVTPREVTPTTNASVVPTTSKTSEGDAARLEMLDDTGDTAAALRSPTSPAPTLAGGGSEEPAPFPPVTTQQPRLGVAKVAATRRPSTTAKPEQKGFGF